MLSLPHRAGYVTQFLRAFLSHARPLGSVVLFLLSITLGAQTQTVGNTKTSDPKPAAQIDLASFGYQIPNSMERLTDGEASSSLNFLDNSHVLLTFDNKGLFRRHPGCPPAHADRNVHAVVVDLVTGKAVKETDWYLHDREPYVWPFGVGKVLLRKLNELYVVDADLHEQLLWSAHNDLLWVAVTPDASQIIVEMPIDPTLQPARPAKGASPPKFEAQFIDAATLKIVRTVPLKQVVELKGTRWGYEDLVKTGDVWLVRFGPAPMQRNNLARVRSQTVPNILYSSSNSLLVGRCPAVGCRYSVTAFSLSGHRLWQQHWPDFHWLPTIARSETNDRFAVSALQILHPTAPPATDSRSADNPFTPDVADGDGFEQQIRVIDTATGTNLISVGVHPAMMADQNFALSPDGRKLASFEGTNLDIFELPPVSRQEQTRLAELNSTLPTFSLASAADADGKPQGDNSKADVDPNFASTGSDDSPSGNSSAAEVKGSPAVENTAASTSDTQIPTFKVTTKAVLLDVVVTDHKGTPIHGLSQEDFRVMEDGKPEEIRSFKEAATTQAPAPAAASPEEKPKKPKRTNDFSNNASTTSTSNTLVLLDLLNTPSQDQVYAQQQLIKFFQSKPKDSQIALCTLSAGGSHLRLIQGFTADETVLQSAINSKRRTKIVAWEASAKGTANADEAVSNLAKEGRMSGFQGLASAIKEVEVEQQGADTDQRVAITLQAFISLSQYLGGVPGRKNVVWLSGSFPIALPSASSWDPSVENRNYSPLIKSVTNVLADAQVAVYPVDVRGLLGGGISAEMAGATGGAPTADSGPQDLDAESVKAPTAAVSDDQQALAMAAGERASIMQVADATGGKAFYNSNGIAKAIETAVEQGANYYSLSYSPSNKTFDGKFRRIKVMLAGKKYTLHYRQGYFAESEHDNKAELARRARAAAMELGAPASRQLSFSVRVVPIGEKKKIDGQLLGEVLVASNKSPSLPAKIEAQHYSVDYSFNPTDLSFQRAANGGRRSTLILMMRSFDREGRPLSARSSAAISELQAADYKRVSEGKVSIHEEFDIPAQAAALRLGIQDRMSGHIGTVEFKLPLPPAPKTGRELPEIDPD